MKHTIEWVKEKCQEILKTILYDFNTIYNEKKWIEEDTVYKLKTNFPYDLINIDTIIERLENKYGRKAVYKQASNIDYEIDVYIDNIDFNIIIDNEQIVVRLYYCLECNNCKNYMNCDDKSYSWETDNIKCTSCSFYEEKEEEKTKLGKDEQKYKRFTDILKEINEDEFKDCNSETELMIAYLEDYQKMREIITDNYEYIDHLVDKNTNTEYSKSVSGLVAVIERKCDEISDLENDNCELKNENEKLSKSLFDYMNDNNVFRNQIKEHLKEMDLICKAH